MGAPPCPDWPLLHEQLQSDARKLLDGEAFSTLSNTDIARDFAERFPQEPMTSRQSVKKRIKRKLDKRPEGFVRPTGQS